MKKILINKDNINNFIEDKKFNKTKEMIISPSANDYLRANNIKIITVDNQKKIETILKTDFNIVDKQILEKIVLQVEEALKNGY